MSTNLFQMTSTGMVERDQSLEDQPKELRSS